MWADTIYKRPTSASCMEQYFQATLFSWFGRFRGEEPNLLVLEKTDVQIPFCDLLFVRQEPEFGPSLCSTLKVRPVMLHGG